MNSIQRKPIKKNELDESNDASVVIETADPLSEFKTPLIQPKSRKNLKVNRVVEVFGKQDDSE